MRGSIAGIIGFGFAALASAAAAQTAPRIATQELKVPALDRLHRIGVALVGQNDPESLAARDLAAQSLVAAGHAVAGLPTFASTPSPAWLLGACAERDLDAVALVSISPAAVGWRANVDIRDPRGEPIVLRTEPTTTGDPFTGSSEPRPVRAAFSFAMGAADVAALQQARTQSGNVQPEPVSVHPQPDRPQLWVSDQEAMLGPARLEGADFYRLVGRPDLAADYDSKMGTIKTLRGFGYTSLGIGGATLVLAVLAAAVTPAACTLPNTVDVLNNKSPSCGNDVGELFLIPLLFGATGGALLLTASSMNPDPISLEERRVLVRDYNARMNASADRLLGPAPAAPRLRLSASAAVSPSGAGGVMLLTGRF